jgi:hypothetical protein
LWLLRAGQFKGLEASARKCFCHGDLHSQNILVDGDGKFWLIDFARAAESHALRDFAELESDIKFNLLQVISLPTLLEFEQALLSAVTFADAPLDLDFNNADLTKAYSVVIALRQIAANHLGLSGDMREYYQALLFHTINMVRLRHIKVEKKNHALLAAALICQRLDDWPDWTAIKATKQIQPSPPASLPTPPEYPLWSRIGAAILLLLTVMGSVLGFIKFVSVYQPGWPVIFAAALILVIFAIILFVLIGSLSAHAGVNALIDLLRLRFNADEDEAVND